MKAYGGVDVWTHVLLTSALVGGEWSASRPGRFTLGERAPGTHCLGGWMGHRVSLDDVEKRKFLTLRVSNSGSIGHPARRLSLVSAPEFFDRCRFNLALGINIKCDRTILSSFRVIIVEALLCMDWHSNFRSIRCVKNGSSHKQNLYVPQNTRHLCKRDFTWNEWQYDFGLYLHCD
jgi:hypothetical protein